MLALCMAMQVTCTRYTDSHLMVLTLPPNGLHYVLLVQADTAEGAFASPISTSEDVSSRHPDSSPAPTSDHLASSSSPPETFGTEEPLPFGSPSAPSGSEQGLAYAEPTDQASQNIAVSQPDVDLPSVAAHETAAADLLLDVSGAPVQAEVGIPPAKMDEASAHNQPDQAGASASTSAENAVLRETMPPTTASHVSENAQANEAYANPASVRIGDADVDSDRVQSSALAATSSKDHGPAADVTSDHAGQWQPSRLSVVRPQSAPVTAHQLRLPSVDLHELALEAGLPLPSRSQSEEPQQRLATTCGMSEEAVTPLPNRRVAALSGGPLPSTPLTQGLREYGCWWTPRIPQALTPAWLKARTPSWLSKVSQVT